MKKIRKILAVIMVFCMIIPDAFAITLDSNASLIETPENSSPLVNVIRVVNGTETVIYTGLLSGYDNGNWSDIDFDTTQFAISFDWDSEADEYLYIVPAENSDEVSSSINNIATTDTNALTTVNTGFDTNIAFWNKDGYCEYINEDYSNISVDVSIKNNSGSTENIQPYFALYESGKLIEAKMGNLQTVSNGSEISLSESFYINKEKADEYTIRVFNWNSGLKPLSEAVSISGDNADFYGDSFDTATLVSDINKEISGNINFAGENDWIKFKAENGTVYEIDCFSILGTVFSIYSSEGNVLSENVISSKINFSANCEYYICIANENNTGDYILTIQENPSGEADNFDIYSYDIELNSHKKEILDICKTLISSNKALSHEIYNNYEDVFAKDLELHNLPKFLKEHPKELLEFDELINRYYRTKYAEFIELKELYENIIIQYDEDYGYDIPGDIGGVGGSKRVLTDDVTAINSEENNQRITIEGMEDVDLIITDKTHNSITCKVVFPISGNTRYTISLLDFNTNDGLSSYEEKFSRTNTLLDEESFTIDNLVPGGIYFVELNWEVSTGNVLFCSGMYRRVQLKYITEEAKTSYPGRYIISTLEDDDKENASDTDFNIWLSRMDSAYACLKDLTGYTPQGGRKIEIRSTRQDLNDLYGVVDGETYWQIIYGWSGFPITFAQPHYRGLMNRLSSGDWGDLPLHEISHNFDKDIWEFDAETLSFFKMYYILTQLSGTVYRSDVATYDSYYGPWYTGDEYYDFLKSDCYISYESYFDFGEYSSGGLAAILIDIEREIDWKPFKSTFRYFSSLDDDQVPETQGDKLKLFLTKLKDYSGEDVLDYISSRDTGIIENHFGITLNYVETIYPSISDGGSIGGGEISASSGSFDVYEFTPTESANYYIYTSPYGGSGVSNDTYLEVYTNKELTGTPIASNDDYDGGRFSKVSVALTEGTTYYIKMRHYSDGQLHAQLNITKNVPVTELEEGGYEDIITANGEYALYSFTPDFTGTYIFEATNYNGENAVYDTYLKLYENESMTKRIGNDERKIVVNLSAGETYYLQFCGYMMKYARGRINVRQGAVVEFSKRTGRNFIYVNSPEYLMKFDMTDGSLRAGELAHHKIFEQKGITGENTYFQTHMSWYGLGKEPEISYPEHPFYLDVDFYNESDKPITIEISNLAYGLSYRDMGDYYTKKENYTLTLAPHEHKLLIETIATDKFILTSNDQERPTILFDFKVTGGSVMVSSLAAYNRANLCLKNGTERTLLYNNEVLDGGFFETDYVYTRLDELDYPGKYKGVAWNQSAWIDSDIEFLIDENTQIGEGQPIYLRDDFYDAVENPKWSWRTALNPIDDDDVGTLSAMPGALHSFRYPYDDTGEREWYFDFLYHDLTQIDKNGTGKWVNTPVSDEAIAELRAIVAAGKKQKGYEIDEAAVSLGEWGTTYHYTITVTNTTDVDRTATLRCRGFSSMTLGYKLSDEEIYQTDFEYEKGQGDNDWWEPFGYTVPANDTITFEVVTTLGVSIGGTTYQFVVR